jgi:broad specificity phosphatase PhoE
MAAADLPKFPGQNAVDSPGWKCCGLFAKKKKTQDPSFKQTIVILRHSERKDQVDRAWRKTEEHMAWQFDSPLTQRGFQMAHDIGVELAPLHRQRRFTLVCCSPYRRCVETASEIAKVLKLPVMIDQEIGEVWEERMPKDKSPHRIGLELQELVKQLGMEPFVKNPLLPNKGGYKLFGRPPAVWPELVEDAHKRMLVRAELYLEQSTKTKQNFILISHALLVASMLDIFDHGKRHVTKLDYCARIIAERTLTAQCIQAAETPGIFSLSWKFHVEGLTMIQTDSTEADHVEQCKEIDGFFEARVMERTVTDFKMDEIIAMNDGKASNSPSRWVEEDGKVRIVSGAELNELGPGWSRQGSPNNTTLGPGWSRQGSPSNTRLDPTGDWQSEGHGKDSFQRAVTMEQDDDGTAWITTGTAEPSVVSPRVNPDMVAGKQIRSPQISPPQTPATPQSPRGLPRQQDGDTAAASGEPSAGAGPMSI